jgi:hypothetical protein
LAILVLTSSDGVKKGKIVLFFGFEHFVLCQHRRDRFCGYGTAHQRGEFAAVMDMRDLETDNQPKAETGDAD